MLIEETPINKDILTSTEIKLREENSALRLELVAANKERDKWKSCVPDECPITGLPFHGLFHDEDGKWRAFYGGPIVSYGLPYKDSDGYLSRERLDEDFMSSEHETTCLFVMEEEELGKMEERLSNMEDALKDAESALSLVKWRKDDGLVEDALRKVCEALKMEEHHAKR